MHELMEVIVHQGIRMDLDAVGYHCVGHQRFKVGEVGVATKDVLAVGSTVDDVVPSAV